MNLREAFDELRQQEAASAPRYVPRTLLSVGSQARTRVSVPQLTFAAMLLITIAVIVFHPPAKPQPSITAWKAPTDFLLQTPGRELLTSVPDLKGSRQ